MNDSEKILTAARRAVAAWREWLGADGAFPEPEYDLFCAAMNALDDTMRKENPEKIPHTP